MPSQLVERVRAKYPGVYDDLDDAALESAVLAKYPEYRDLAEPKPDFRIEVKASDSAPGFLDSALGMAGNLGMGALKGAGQTATNLGQAVHMIPGVSRAVNALYGAPVSQPSFAEADKALTPTNTAQGIGKGVEQIAEFFVPGGAVKRAAQGFGLAGRAALEGAAGAGVAAAQGASPLEAGASGVLAGAPSALAPAGRKLTATMAEHLRAKAAKRVTEGLAAGPKKLKIEAKRIAPEFIERELGGSLESIAEKATEARGAAGRQLGTFVKGEAGQERHATEPILSALEKAKRKLVTQSVDTGAEVVTDKAQHAALGRLQDVVREYGDEMTLQQVNALKKLYARSVAKSGGYDTQASEILNTAPEAARSFAAILRKEENGVEALAKLNKEFRFWKSLEKISTDTVNRRTSQNKGLIAALVPAAGGVSGGAAGFASGDGMGDRLVSGMVGSVGGAIAGIPGRKLTVALQSPQWKFVRARYADKLAQALAHKDPERIGQVVGKILAAEAAH